MPTITSESVTEGHPDKLADQISDAVLDAILTDDPDARVACEALVSTGLVLIAGEITTSTYVDVASIARQTIVDAGYDHAATGFDGNTCAVLVTLDQQSPDIAAGVDNGGAGDQGMMFGYACRDTFELMPAPISFAHRLTAQLADHRQTGVIPYLRPDGKAQVTCRYNDNGGFLGVSDVVVSTQHADGIGHGDIEADVRRLLVEPCIGSNLDDNYKLHVNPTGRFVLGGPHGDVGLTGRKIIVDTYGGAAHHGGGAFSGKDPSKVDRSAAYAARWVAKNIVGAELALRCEVQLAYAIGIAEPVDVNVTTFGTANGDLGINDRDIAYLVRQVFDLTPGGIIRDLDLCRPIYRPTATYGHFGRTVGKWLSAGSQRGYFPWEQTNRVDALLEALAAS